MSCPTLYGNLADLAQCWHAVGMADTLPKQRANTITRSDPADTGLGMYLVPTSHKAALDDADLACVHIAENGLGGRAGVKAVQYFYADDRKLAVCQACSHAIATEKAVGATVH